MKSLLRTTSRLVGIVALALFITLGSSSAATGVRVSTVVGTGVSGTGGDDGPAAAATFDEPRSVIITKDGSLLIADAFRDTIRRVAPDGTITRFAGTGASDYGGDGGPAIRAAFHLVHCLSQAADGSILVADPGNNRIRRIGPDGIVTTVAGIAYPGFNGDGAPATSTRLNNPRGVAALPDGSFLIADSDNNRIRKVSPNGIITTVAGTGDAGFSGDGGPATSAEISTPFGVSVMPDGAFLIDDIGNQRVRRVSPSGIITTVAGNGKQGFGGDGGPATSAELNNAHNVLARRDGSFFITDTGNHRVRLVSANGTITTVVGNGRGGYGGDGGPPLKATLNDPKSIAETPSGALVIADPANHRVRFVGSASQPYFSPLQLTVAAPASVGRAHGISVHVTPSTWASVGVKVTSGKRVLVASRMVSARPGSAAALKVGGLSARGTFTLQVTSVSEFGQKVQLTHKLRVS